MQESFSIRSNEEMSSIDEQAHETKRTLPDITTVRGIMCSQNPVVVMETTEIGEVTRVVFCFLCYLIFSYFIEYRNKSYAKSSMALHGKIKSKGGRTWKKSYTPPAHTHAEKYIPRFCKQMPQLTVTAELHRPGYEWQC